MHIRPAMPADREAVHEINHRAFPAEEREIVAELAVRLLAEASEPLTLSLVAESHGELIGHVAFSPVMHAGEVEMQGYILGPLAVKPALQRQGIGAQLIEKGKAGLAQTGVNVLLVYGDPAYYGRFGFTAELAQSLQPPYALKHPFGWLACMLNACEMPESAIALTCVPALSDPKYW